MSKKTGRLHAKLFYGVFFSLSFLLGIVFFNSSFAMAADPGIASLSFDQETMQVNPGDTFDVYINVNNANNISGMDCQIVFDRLVVQALGIEPAGDLKDLALLTAKREVGEFDNKQDYAWLAVAVLGEKSVPGNGALANVSFKALQDGICSLRFESASLLGTDINLMAVEHHNMLVTVGNGGAPSNNGGDSSNSSSQSGQNSAGENAQQPQNNQEPNQNQSAGGNLDNADGILNFKDLTSKHWASSYLAPLVNKNIIKGYEDNSFRPENSITRAEYVTIMLRALGEGIAVSDSAQKFNDYDEIPDWAKSWVAAAASLELIRGDGNNCFRAKDSITRAEATAILVRAFEKENVVQTMTPGSTLFVDLSEHWASDEINRALKQGLVSGYPDNTFRPDKPVTRAEACVLVSRLLTITGKL